MIRTDAPLWNAARGSSYAARPMTIDRDNQAVFERRDVVRWYATRDALQGAEEAFLREVTPELGEASMLDVGVGGGRTTLHFAPRVKRYVGIDYAPKMIEACKERFQNEPDIELRVEDARKLPFADGEFDFVLFSHCGIDYVTHEDRLLILKELRRVVRTGGRFFFSTHNLARVRTLLEGGQGETLVRRALGGIARRRLRRMNPPLATLEGKDHFLLNDGAFRSGALTYHIRAGAQRAQLEALGFSEVRVMSSQTGLALDAEAASSTDEPWLSYAARAC
jgi:SAM-dependent methyltransferase